MNAALQINRFPILTPLIHEIEATSLREWKEKLSFVSTTKDLSIEGLRKSFGEVQRTDPGFTFSIRKSKGALLATFQLPKWNERGVQKIVRRDNTFISISYEERIGPEADERLRLWTGFLEKLTAETLREMRLD